MADKVYLVCRGDFEGHQTLEVTLDKKYAEKALAHWGKELTKFFKDHGRSYTLEPTDPKDFQEGTIKVLQLQDGDCYLYEYLSIESFKLKP